jgi:hypothetical protein
MTPTRNRSTSSWDPHPDIVRGARASSAPTSKPGCGIKLDSLEAKARHEAECDADDKEQVLAEAWAKARLVRALVRDCVEQQEVGSRLAGVRRNTVM